MGDILCGGEWHFHIRKTDRYFSMLYDTFSIVRINLDTFETCTVFQDNANLNRTLALGLGEATQDAYFPIEPEIYILNKKSAIYELADGKGDPKEIGIKNPQSFIRFRPMRQSLYWIQELME